MLLALLLRAIIITFNVAESISLQQRNGTKAEAIIHSELSFAPSMLPNSQQSLLLLLHTTLLMQSWRNRDIVCKLA